MAKWTIEPHDGADKQFVINGPLPLIIDYDDVNHGEVDALAESVVAILNAGWEG